MYNPIPFEAYALSTTGGVSTIRLKRTLRGGLGGARVQGAGGRGREAVSGAGRGGEKAGGEASGDAKSRGGAGGERQRG
eukprot:2199226-Pyramimonas_sp.AAC.1